ncbi:MAG: hypothetical protein QF864_09325, partial [SAR202 cluster bacterium]|nr:hypothetical protein [SAR202 cluster bacterium]
VDGLKFEDLKRLSPEEVVDVLVRVGKQFGAANHAVGFTEHPTDSVSLKQRVRSLHPDTKTIAFYRLTGRKAVSQLENGEHPDFTEYGLSKWSNGRNTPESASFYRLNLTLHMGNTQRDLTPKTH